MTGIDLLIGMLLMGCVDGREHRYHDEGVEVSIQRYECPLIGQQAEFYVWRRVCEFERPAWAIEDHRTGKGFVYNRFGGIDTAFVNVEQFPVSLPPCP